MTKIIEAETPGGGRRYAAIDPDVRFTPPGTAGSRLGAMLHPYTTEAAAVAALEAEGALVGRKAA